MIQGTSSTAFRHGAGVPQSVRELGPFLLLALLLHVVVLWIVKLPQGHWPPVLRQVLQVTLSRQPQPPPASPPVEVLPEPRKTPDLPTPPGQAKPPKPSGKSLPERSSGSPAISAPTPSSGALQSPPAAAPASPEPAKTGDAEQRAMFSARSGASDVDRLLDSAHNIARETGIEMERARRNEPKLRWQPRDPPTPQMELARIMGEAFQHCKGTFKSEQMGDGSLKVTNSDGSVYYLYPTPVFAQGGPGEHVSVPLAEAKKGEIPLPSQLRALMNILQCQ